MSEHRINSQIKANVVRLITDEKTEILDFNEALRQAKNQGLDLVQFSESSPPVVKILNYDKFKFEENKRRKEAVKKSKASKSDLKELQFRPVTGQHDVDRLIDHAKKFITQGHKVKLVCKFKGREQQHRVSGIELMNKIIDAIGEKLDGRVNTQDRNISAIVTKA